MRKKWTEFGIVVVIGVLLLSFPLATACAPAKPVVPGVHEVTKIDIYGASAGSHGFAMVHALAETVNKHSTWLKASGLATKGIVDNYLTVGPKPALRKNTVVYGAKYDDAAVRLRTGAYKEVTFEPPLHISIGLLAQMYVMTLDPKIKTWDDLAGKKIVTDVVGAAKRTYFLDFTKAADLKFTDVPVTAAAGKDALLSGTADAMWSFLTFTGAEATHATAMVELLALRPGKVYYIHVPKKFIEKAAKDTGTPYVYLEIPPLYPGMGPTQTEKLGGMGVCNTFAAWTEMPNDVTYEIARVSYEYAHEFVTYFKGGATLSRDRAGWLYIESEKEVHPGALAFYKEKKIKLGMPTELR